MQTESAQHRDLQSSKEALHNYFICDCWVSETVEWTLQGVFHSRELSCAVRDAARVSGRGWLLLQFKHRLITSLAILLSPSEKTLSVTRVCAHYIIQPRARCFVDICIESSQRALCRLLPLALCTSHQYRATRRCQSTEKLNKGVGFAFSREI